MEKVSFGGYPYNKVNLKNGGCVYVEPFNDGEETDRRKIYDGNMNYLDYISLEWGDEDCDFARYNEIIRYFETMEDIHNYLGCLFPHGYTCGHGIDDFIDQYIQDLVLDYTPEELEDREKELHEELDRYGEQQFCAEHMINRIGNLYFYGE